MLQDAILQKLRPREEQYDLSDRDGLWVRVYPSGKISFYFRYRLHGKAERVVLGPYPTISLKRARILSGQARALVADGVSPATQKQTKRRDAIRERSAETVKDLCDEWMTRYVEQYRKQPHIPREILNANVIPSIGNIMCTALTRRDVIRMLDKIVDRGARSMANHTLAVVKQMLRFGVERGILTHNVCAEIRRQSVGGIPKPRDRNLTSLEIKRFWTKVEEFPTHKSVPIALKLLLLTAQRRGELSAAEWSHVDLNDRKIWTIPASNSKNGKEHKVPLTPAAVELFQRLKTLSANSRYVLPSPQAMAASRKPGKADQARRATATSVVDFDEEVHITERAVTRAVKRHSRLKLGIAEWVPHDLRRTASTQLAKLGVAPHIKEKILNHAMPPMMAVYDRYDYMDERRAALELLAARVLAISETDDELLKAEDADSCGLPASVAAACEVADPEARPPTARLEIEIR